MSNEKRINKVLRIGSIQTYGGRWASVYCKVEMEFEHRNPADNDERTSRLIKPSEIKFAACWTVDKWLDFLDVWKKWHLNDMQANCEHQIGPEWDTGKKLTIYYFRLTKSVEEIISTTEKRAIDCIKSGKEFKATAEETKLALLPKELKYHLSELPKKQAPFYEPNGPQYERDCYNKASEVKTAGLAKKAAEQL